MPSTGLVPLIRYRDVAAAIDWLTQTFGFDQRSVVHDPDGTIAYAELSYGHGLLMIGPVGQSVLDSLLRQPDELGGIGTQSCYVAVEDVEAHFQRAKNAGAEIVLEFGSDEAGDRAYAARDPEGHVWNFGAYSPWRSLVSDASRGASPSSSDGEVLPPPTKVQSVLAAGVAAVALVSVAAVAMLDMPPAAALRAGLASAAPAAADARQSSTAGIDDVRRERDALRTALDREAHARREASRTAATIREALSRERTARQSAETEATRLKSQLVREREVRIAPKPETQSRGPDSAPAGPKPSQSAKAPDPAPQADDTPQARIEQPASATAAATPATAPPPATTGSLGDNSKAVDPAPLAEPEPDTDLSEPEPDEAPTAAANPSSTDGNAEKSDAAKATISQPKKERPKPQRRAKATPSPKKSSSASKPNNPFFMYD